MQENKKEPGQILDQVDGLGSISEQIPRFEECQAPVDNDGSHQEQVFFEPCGELDPWILLHPDQLSILLGPSKVTKVLLSMSLRVHPWRMPPLDMK
jgi:hypothetical protein